MWYMKKTLVLITLLLLFLSLSSVCKASFSVTPMEVSISMKNEFINGNTSKTIAISNNKNYSYNVTWYTEHPKPISWIRPNRMRIPNLSWINVEPKWIVIPPKSIGIFYIHLFIPENNDTLNPHWETWVTFKGGKQEYTEGFFHQEYAVRVYIDTPEKLASSDNPDNDVLSISTKDQLNITLLDVTVAAIIAIVLLFIGNKVLNRKKA